MVNPVGWGSVNLVHLAKVRNQRKALVNTVTNLGGSVKCWGIIGQLSDWQILKDSALWSWLAIS